FVAQLHGTREIVSSGARGGLQSPQSSECRGSRLYGQQLRQQRFPECSQFRTDYERHQRKQRRHARRLSGRPARHEVRLLAGRATRGREGIHLPAPLEIAAARARKSIFPELDAALFALPASATSLPSTALPDPKKQAANFL